MRKPLAVLAILCLIIIALDVARVVRTDDPPTEAFTTLTSQPPRAVTHPQSNGYFLLLGFAAAPTADAVQAGHEMWLESESDRGFRFFDYDKDFRAQLQVESDTETVQQAWSDPDTIVQLRKLREPLSNLRTQYAILMDRYRRWLAMPFDEWGFGHPGCPRFADIFAIHRLYVADGFARDVPSGVERLENDLTAWRTVLGHATTLPTKIMAASVLDDDLTLLSALLSRADLDVSLLSRLAKLARSLSQAERSLQWPIRNEFVLGVSRYVGLFASAAPVLLKGSERNRQWVATVAGLSPEAFQRAELTVPTNSVVRNILKRQKSLNVYAVYFENVLKVADTLNSPFPKLQDFADYSTNLLDDLDPLNNALRPDSDFSWEPFRERLLETEARLRLATVQARLRTPSSAQTIPARIAEVGSAYYDPFTGIPMLWSQARGRLYSIGPDGKDDGGDAKLDVSVQVPAVLGGPPAGSSHPVP